MKILNGAELAGFVKERQAKEVRALKQSVPVTPKLVIIQTAQDPVINTYVRLKKSYGQDIGVMVESMTVKQEEVTGLIKKNNEDSSVHGIIVQLPLSDPSQTEAIVNNLASEKDVDGLGPHARYNSATAIAINWLLAGYNIELKGKKIIIIGHGRLVGRPLYDMWQGAGYEVSVIDSSTEDFAGEVNRADVIISATGAAGLLTSDMVPVGAVVVDAGVASEAGKTVGDLAEEVYGRHDLTVTPKKGGVGPLTVAALFDNVLRASRN